MWYVSDFVNNPTFFFNLGCNMLVKNNIDQNNIDHRSDAEILGV